MERKTSKREPLLAALSVGATAVVCILIIQHQAFVDHISHWGYLGCFIINILATGTFVLPGMGAVITFTLGGVLHPAVVGVVAGLGEATGAVGAYLTGYGGRALLVEGQMQDRFSKLMQRHGSKAMFIMAALVNPIYYPFAVWMGVLRVRIGKFFVYTFLGRTLKNMLLAYLGYFGMKTVLQWVGLAL